MNCFESKKSLKVERAFKYDGEFPLYDLPTEIGCFSLNGKSRYCNDGHQLKYLSMPDKITDLCMDLNEGFYEFIGIPEDTDYDSTMKLKWILSHQKVIKEHFMDWYFLCPKVDFVCDRGILTKLSSTIYETSEDWMIRATKFRSAIYLVEIRTEQKSERVETATEQEIRWTTYGFKFEQCMVSDTMHSKPDTSVPVNENEKYFAVYKGKLKHHRLLFYAEVDGADPNYFSDSGCDLSSPLRYIELKTSRLITTYKQHRNFKKYKLIKWFLQSFLGGTPKIICGFRDDEGIVRELQTFNVNDLPEMCQGFWSPAACLNFTSHFLDFVEHCVTKDKIVYQFYWKPHSDVSCEELEPDAFHEMLPKWYTKNIKVI